MDESPLGIADPDRSAQALAAFPPLSGVRHRFVDLPGLRMHVAEAGAGDPVLLLHGFPEHWWEWRGVMGALARTHRVIAPDLRGAGWTDAPRGGYERHQLTADAIALLDALELDRVHVIGHDWGALLGFQLAFRHPERVRSLLSLATPHPYIRLKVSMLREMWRLWFQPVVATPGLGPRLIGHGRQRLARFLFRGYVFNQQAWSEDDIEIFLRPLRDPAHARAGSALYRGFILREAGRIVAGRYRERLVTPTVVLYGGEDPGVKREFLGGYEEFADDLTLEVVSGASHFIPEERPDLVVDRALALLAAH